MSSNMREKKVKVLVDLAMALLLPILMAYELVGEAAHEWIGIAMFALFILHNVLNYKWYKGLFKGWYSRIRILGTIVNALLLIMMFSLMFSGVAMSRHIFAFLPIDHDMAFARILHLLASYWGFMLMSVHVGLHWNMVIGGIRKATHISNPSVARTAILRMIAALISVYGAYAFVQREIGTYMLLQNQFVFFDYYEPLVFFFADYLAIMGLFICVGYYASKMARKISLKSFQP